MVDLQGQAVVAILTRAPSAGGKTRLFAALGRSFDPHLLAALFLDTLDAASVAGWTRVACYTPASAAAEMRALVGDGVPLVPQRGDGLGARMRHAFEDLLAAGAAAVVLIGSDLPLIDGAVLVDTLRILARQPDTIVLGPAADGGYYLIGATRVPAALFEAMTWGGADVLEQTERRARAAGLITCRVAVAEDVDTPDALSRVLRHHDERGWRTRSAFGSGCVPGRR